MTAAALYGVPLPDYVDQTRVDVAVAEPATAPRATGVHGHRVSGVRQTTHDGFGVAAPDDVWAQLSGLIAREDLVAAGDYLITGKRSVGGRRAKPLCSLELLELSAARHAGKRGMSDVWWALPRIRSGVDSPMESRTRLLLVASRLPEPVIGQPVAVERGTLLLHPDLCWPRWKIVLEYEGDGHRTDRRQWLLDIRRREQLEAAGWRVIRVTSLDLFDDPAGFIRRVRDIIAQQKRREG